MSLRKRLATNTFVNLACMGLNALAQLAQVAILSSAWPLEKYGTWILLSTVPAYFALTDLGFSAAAQSDMSMSYARGDVEATRTTYQSTWTLLVGMSVAVMVLASLGLLGFDVLSAPGAGGHVFALRYGPTLIMFVAYALISVCSRLTLSGFRATGLYAQGTILYEVSMFLETAAIVGVAMLGGGFDQCVLAGIVSRVVWTVVMNEWLAAAVPGVRLGFTSARRAELRRLLAPALGALAMPISLALNLQGIVGVIGYTVSPAAVALFTPVRTLSRVALQVVGAFNRASMPEVSRAASTANQQHLRRLLGATFATSAVVLLPAAVLFCLLGKRVVEFWTHGHVSPPTDAVVLLGADMFIQGTWYFMTNLLLATNEHTRTASASLAFALATIALAIPAGYQHGLTGVAASIALGDLATLLYVASKFKASGLFQGAFGPSTTAHSNTLF